jgi:hypothetical protein
MRRPPIRQLGGLFALAGLRLIPASAFLGGLATFLLATFLRGLRGAFLLAALFAAFLLPIRHAVLLSGW